ncbi:hypothetical protein FCL47_14580 [Desulfopila sp. IMCC35006]|uniref:toprim domain-containing protein n=1 Tax=Desulfopila sp. IMCC35006 TaxID=2569542 RepID=UPI0010ABD2D9|nr:toprim domain-containing protein [Desulfopila sp. IMCC35006]TKB25280.1 hypothetical protein FCL47_14580 [Desulfopila sp. IMCC35006]
MSRAREIARFYGQGKEEKNRDGFLTLCPCHGESTPSLSVTDAGPDDVKVFCHVGCDYKAIKDQFRADGLLPEWKPDHAHDQASARTKTPAPVPETKEAEDPSYIWKKATRDLEPVKKYLAGRAITIDPLPPCFKFNHYINKESETVDLIVAAASTLDDTAVYAVQRLFIDVEKNKKTGAKMHGPCEGRGIWFNREGDHTEIVIGEGIETTLSAIQATGKNGVAALSTAGMKGLVIPDKTNTIYILVDSDQHDEKEQKSMPGQKAACILAKKFTDSRPGRVALIVSPDDTCFSEAPVKLDFNDLLQADPTGESIRSRFAQAVNFEKLTWTPPGSSQDKKDHSQSNHDSVDYVTELFSRYVFVQGENKIYDTWSHDPKDGMMCKDAFIIAHAGHFHHYKDEEGKDQIKPAALYWLGSNIKKTVSAFRYEPGKPSIYTDVDGRSYYNTFRFPFQLTPVMPDEELEIRLQPWHRLMDTVFHEHRGYIEDWFAFTVQYPAKRSGIMPVCISHVGLGKSLIMAIVSRVLGSQNFSNGKILDITGLGKSGAQWGDWIFNKKLSCIEEIDPEGETGVRYRVTDSLKDLITNETLSVNLKGGKTGTYRVYSNIIGFSNHRDCLKIPYGDRRFFIVDSTGQQLLSFDEYGEIWEWMRDDRNIMAVYQYLMSREISKDFIPGQAKMTPAKERLQQDGRSLMQTAFDVIISDFPCDLMTTGELQLAVCQVMHFLEGGDWIMEARNLNADKQFNAILRSMTTLVCNGHRLRIRREGGSQMNPSQIRAIRNATEWNDRDSVSIREAMFVKIPLRWIRERDDETFTLF